MLDKVFALHHNKKGNTKVNLYAHNGSRFDAYIIMHELKESSYQFAKIVKAGSRLLRLVIKREDVTFNFLCTATHLTSSLNDLCKAYKLDSRLIKK